MNPITLGRLLGTKAVANMQVTAKTASATLRPDEIGVIHTTGAAAATVFTLPPKAVGLWYIFYNTVDQNMTITADVADTLVVLNDAAADSMTFVTSSEKIGAAAAVVCDGSKWFGVALQGTMTPAT